MAKPKTQSMAKLQESEKTKLATNRKMVYAFEEGSAAMKLLLGNKGANLAEMTGLGLPVPPGFIITTEANRHYLRNDYRRPKGLDKEIKAAMRELEKKMQRKFGDPNNPLLVSVRSGAIVSMPGMMDTVLNLGLNDETVKGLIKQTGDERFAWDAYRRFIQGFGGVVLGVEREEFEHVLDSLRKKQGVKTDPELSVASLKRCVSQFKSIVRKRKGKQFPQDVWEQLLMAVEAVFKSWNNPRAISYRRINKISDFDEDGNEVWGTAVNVQAMVFGNMGWDSGTGVGFTRDPATGDPNFYADYLPNAQGEDVVAGVRTPSHIEWLRENAPQIYSELLRYSNLLERHYGDMQDIEFTVERGKLWMLQTRSGKRTGEAAIRVAVDMVGENIISPDDAILMVEASGLEQLLHPQFDPDAVKKAVKLAKGTPASPGAASGRIAFDADTAVEMAKNEPVILVRRFTSPDDIEGMKAARGVLTAQGGRTSHAAVVSRGMGKTCVVGCGALDIDYEAKRVSINGKVFKEGDFISISGSTGEVYEGSIPAGHSEIIRVELGELDAKESQLYQYFKTFMKWADERRRLGVRANADLPHEAELARKLGAEGIGLARTEHMFFARERLPYFQHMILADDPKERAEAAKKLLPFQRNDFYGLLKAMDGLPVIIRLLDPPLHEFTPKTEAEIQELSKFLGIPSDEIQLRSQRLHEENPMLGHRGCRLGVTFPEIYRMQAQAIFEAACELKKQGYNPVPEVMIPLVAHVNELVLTKADVVDVAEKVMAKKGVRMKYMVGTMIELPRSALTADQIGAVADFFSYGTNDLTQTAFGLSRDDAQRFIAHYLEEIPDKEGTPVLSTDPFEVIDRDGVGELIRIGIERGRKANPNLEVGICGEHGGEPNSVWFCHEVGMDYVSCSTYRVPVARLAAAQAAVREARLR